MKKLTVFLTGVLVFAFSLQVGATETPRKMDWSGVYFLGESTTAHLRKCGDLLGTCAKTNVLTTDAGTLTLSERTLTEKLSKSKISLAEAIQNACPPVLVLSFGLNGIAGFHKDESRYFTLYRRLIQTIRSLSPKTILILQTIYPVAKEQREWKFASPPKEVNQWIEQLNQTLPEFAKQNDVYLADTATCLRDEAGFTKAEYSADGIHLTKAGYAEILQALQFELEKRMP